MQGTKVNEQLFVTGQVTTGVIQEAARDGYRSVLNLRAPEEPGVLPEEKQAVEAAGLQYVNRPVRKDQISDALTTEVLAEIDRLPKPMLIHCASGMRAGAMAFMHMATRQGMTADEAMEKAQAQGFDCNSEPQLKAFFEQYVTTYPGGR